MERETRYDVIYIASQEQPSREMILEEIKHLSVEDMVKIRKDITGLINNKIDEKT